MGSSSPLAVHTLCLAYKVRAVCRYERKKNKPAVLVIDSAELLAEHGVLAEILEAARGWADRGLVRVVLVTSDDDFVQRLTCAQASAAGMT